ncbi:bifunctional UDP-sugar hydrolase/5'-nucleotidase [Corynebacterium sp. p3-SID1194]|uniref:bifunctional metallophosphatase/5'-nucleotidase n=1 Tax=Corynebacterium sp. p3-SID1194 TaxID=2916105 RepID=UPI0021A85660|nr:bifunctional UDP-sugar hydrolase/5'-nucleotidase [Corynebacterium sp. p3-SID1194]MCT1450073.1 bifunctional metallophosphatase/5'-nucleotidase [Corynebacterium sp. p3-SID1194]
MRNRVLCATIAALSVSAGVLSPVTATADENIAKISISNITDFHGRFAPNDVNVRGTDTRDDEKSIPGAERLKCAIDTEAEGYGDAHILTSSGDNIGASPFSAMLLDDAPTIEVLNEMGLEVSAVGNHEFDKGAKDLSDRVIPDAKFPYLAANAETVEGTKPYHVEEVDGVKVAFIGTVTDDMPNLVSPDGIEGITWNDPVATTNALAKQIKGSKEADVVVALVHAGGITPDKFENVDVAFLGHTHVYVKPDTSTAPVVAQAGQYSQGFANVDLSIDRATKKITVDDAKVVDNATVLGCTDKKYPEIATIVDAAEAEAEEQGKQVVAKTPVDFTRGKNEGAESGSNRGVESSLNNLLAEAAKWSVAANSSVTPDIGIMNAGGVRDDLPAGDITYQQAFSVQPFGNENSYKTLKGADFKDALEQQWKPGQDRPRLALGLSNNVSYTYNPDAEQGNRITSITIDGKPMDMDKDYIVAGSTFLLGGGDSFDALTKGSEMSNIGLVDVDAFIQYLKSGEKLTPRGQSAVGVKFEQPLKAGQDAKIDLSSLIYSQNDDAKKVTVALENKKGKKIAEGSADIDPALGEKGLGEAGKASVKLAVPAKVPADAVLRITTDKGTDVTMPVEIEGGQKGGQDSSSGSSNDGSSAKPVLIGLGVTGLLAALAGVIVAFVPQFAPVRDQINAALKDFGIQI